MDNNQLFEQIKLKQLNSVQSSNFSNENVATATNNQTIIEKHDKNRLIVIPFQGEKEEEQVIESEKQITVK